MRWWEGFTGINCTFALDSTSITTENRVYFSNDTSRFLTLTNGINKAKTGITRGLKFENFKLESLNINEYQSLNIFNTNLLFDTPLPITDEFTLILKCKINQSTVFISNSSSEYGPTFGIGINENIRSEVSSDFVWRFSGFTPDIATYKIAQDIKTIVIKGTMSTKDIYVYTDTEVFKIPTDSVSFTTGFLVPRTYTTLGYNHTNPVLWCLNSDIIAFGIFDKALSDIQIEKLKNDIDSEFKIKTIEIEKPFYNSSFSDFSIKNQLKINFSNFNTFDNYFQSSKAVKNNIKESIYNINYSLNVSNNLYKNVKNIKDIVLEEGVPIQTKLYLYEKSTGQFLKTTNSNKLGEFIFLDLDVNANYIVRASDKKYQFQSILKDYNEVQQ